MGGFSVTLGLFSVVMLPVEFKTKLMLEFQNMIHVSRGQAKLNVTELYKASTNRNSICILPLVVVLRIVVYTTLKHVVTAFLL